jgi:aspartate kinase
MKVFKFGGASIKDAISIQNMAEIIAGNNNTPLVIVVSAMGKTTNKLEEILYKKLRGEHFDLELAALITFHKSIINALFEDRSPQIEKKIKPLFEELEEILNEHQLFKVSDLAYDAVVSFGELLSSTIIAQYLNHKGITVRWIDARDIIQTDSTFREGKIDWEITEAKIINNIGKELTISNFITQGFIGKSLKGQTTTLGREGSDFTAAILGACLSAESVTIWKDVPGIMNADPKKFDSTELYTNLSYHEAAEMTYYGASVIHPKTIKPLANKNIPLLVKSFERPHLDGTVINQGNRHKLPPTYVIKDNQCLVSFGVKDLTFINEKNLSIIFHVLDELNIKINMMQNSAVSLTTCFDNREDKLSELINMLKNDFKILFTQNLQLITIKNYSQEAIDKVTDQKEILVEQRTRNTYQIVIK